MGQHRNVTAEERELVVGNPSPAVVGPDEVFTVDDDADEVYNVPGVYQPVASPTSPPPPPATPSPSTSSATPQGD